VRTADIDWIEASGNYLRLSVAGEWHSLREHADRLMRVATSTARSIAALVHVEGAAFNIW